MNLSKAPSYFPIANGRYEVAPGLRPFGTDFGGDEFDKKLFQIDHNYFDYLNSKHQARNSNLNKYYPDFHDLSEIELAEVCKFIATKLVEEHPDKFSALEADGKLHLKCHLSSEELSFDLKNHFKLQSDSYRDAFDALAMQVQEDLAIWKLSDNKEWLAAVHLCSPNHWDPNDKVGKSFMNVHAPVADFEKLRPISMKLVEGMVQRGPFVRFAWGVAADTDLNHHPDKIGRQFDQTRDIYLRIERQTLHPFAEKGLSLFTIKTYFTDCLDLDISQRELLVKAIEGMSEEALRYKGLVSYKDKIISQLRK